MELSVEEASAVFSLASSFLTVVAGSSLVSPSTPAGAPVVAATSAPFSMLAAVVVAIGTSNFSVEASTCSVPFSSSLALPPLEVASSVTDSCVVVPETGASLPSELESSLPELDGGEVMISPAVVVVSSRATADDEFSTDGDVVVASPSDDDDSAPDVAVVVVSSAPEEDDDAVVVVVVSSTTEMIVVEDPP